MIDFNLVLRTTIPSDQILLFYSGDLLTVPEDTSRNNVYNRHIVRFIRGPFQNIVLCHFHELLSNPLWLAAYFM